MSPLSAENCFAQAPDAAFGIRSYVLRSGRGTNAQRRSYDSLAERFIVPFENVTMNFTRIFGNNNPVTVEIGFGMGMATAIIAEENPSKNYVGIEVHKPGIGRLLWEVEQRSLSNIRVVEYDAVPVFERMIPLRSLEGIHLFFPDPWPKKRHHKRRLVKRPFTDALAAHIRPGGYLYMVTDWEDYADWALEELGATDGLVNSALSSMKASNGFAPPQDWRPRTAFEKKGLAKNHQVRELFFYKNEKP
ncbi:MAG: tRNA (guanosine(46)-N7)-methyltransferase TrmB [Treponema sp.]|jgi:tRNA (guanine-N7-)-methyltransferase|nr:tRNA (guanosine(46)-N7)-methyltransferase TrmB [Treponema sp.]